MSWSDLTVATDHDALFIGKGVEPIAKTLVNGKKPQEGVLHRESNPRALPRSHRACRRSPRPLHAAGETVLSRPSRQA